MACTSLGVVVAAGFALAGAGPAFADTASGGLSTLTCTPDIQPSGAPIMRCTATDANGVKSIHAQIQDTGITPNFGVAAASQPCSPAPSNTLTLTFDNFFFLSGQASRYRVVVPDCAGEKNTYRVLPDGTVVRAKGVLTVG